MSSSKQMMLFSDWLSWLARPGGLAQLETQQSPTLQNILDVNRSREKGEWGRGKTKEVPPLEGQRCSAY